jgi:TonB family protein
VIALAAGLLLAAASDTTTLVPGTSLRFGLPLTTLEARGFRQPGAIAGVTLSGPCRFFGIPSEATLHFEDSLLVRAEFDATASDYEARYVEDQLRRHGYRRGCRTLSDGMRDCDWTGRTRLTLLVREGTIHAVADTAEKVAVASPPSPREPVPPPVHAAPPETLSFVSWPNPDSVAASLTTFQCAVDYPARAREENLQGRVRVRALVDEKGAVVRTTLVNSIPLLDDAAVKSVSCRRFKPLEQVGRPVLYWVEVHVRYTLH